MTQNKIELLIDAAQEWAIELQNEIDELNEKDELTDSQQEKLDHLEYLLKQVNELDNALNNVYDGL